MTTSFVVPMKGESGDGSGGGGRVRGDKSVRVGIELAALVRLLGTEAGKPHSRSHGGGVVCVFYVAHLR